MARPPSAADVIKAYNDINNAWRNYRRVLLAYVQHHRATGRRGWWQPIIIGTGRSRQTLNVDETIALRETTKLPTDPGKTVPRRSRTRSSTS
jgi:hypothetical protein